MNGKQQAVAVTGLALVVANFWTTDARPLVTAGLSGDPAAQARAHSELKTLGLELLFVAGAAMLAGFSDGLGTAMVAIIAALAILWAVNHYAGGTRRNANGAITA